MPLKPGSIVVIYGGPPGTNDVISFFKKLPFTDKSKVMPSVILPFVPSIKSIPWLSIVAMLTDGTEA